MITVTEEMLKHYSFEEASPVDLLFSSLSYLGSNGVAPFYMNVMTSKNNPINNLFVGFVIKHFRDATGEFPKTVTEALQYAPAVETTNNMLINCQRHIQRELDAFEKAEEAKRKEEVLTVFRDMNKVHEQGTVAEIAQRLGISKSEVRRRKLEGTL